MSDTPRTDAACFAVVSNDPKSVVVWADFARQLERENAALREKNAEWREMIREAVFDNNDILYWIRGARRVLLSEVEKDHAARKKAQT